MTSRRSGPDPAQTPSPGFVLTETQLQAAMNAAEDWKGTCDWCGEKLVGTRAELKGHGAVCSRRPDVV